MLWYGFVVFMQWYCVMYGVVVWFCSVYVTYGVVYLCYLFNGNVWCVFVLFPWCLCCIVSPYYLLLCDQDVYLVLCFMLVRFDGGCSGWWIIN